MMDGYAVTQVVDSRADGLAAGDIVVPPASGRAQFERVLEALARVDFSPRATMPSPPLDRAACVLVGTAPRPGDWTDVRLAGRPGAPE